MKVHLLERAQRVPLDVDETFRFYSEVGNLERITPPWLRFRILDPRPDRLIGGAHLQYSLVLHFVPIRWTTEIDEWEPPAPVHRLPGARPVQAVGAHAHVRAGAGGGTLMTDTIRYAIPYGPLGSLAHVAFVRRDLRRIFDYRRDTVSALLGGKPA